MSRPLVVITTCVTLVVLFLLGQSDAILQGESLQLLTADDQMRIARVLDLVQGRNGWFDNDLHWSNTPFGTSLHWTRPLDALVILLAAPFALFVAWNEAVRIGGFVSSPVLYAALLGTAWWATRRLANTKIASFAVTLLGTTLAITWLVDGSKARFLLVFAASWGGGLLTASLLEHGPSNIAVLEYDRLSRPHLILGFAAMMGAIVIVVIDRSARTRQRPLDIRQRCLTLVGAVLVAIVVLGISRLDLIDLVRAPYSTIPDDIRNDWLEQLEEFRSVVQLPIFAIVAYTAIPVVALVIAARHVIMERSTAKHPNTWTIMTLWHIAASAVGFVNVRSLIYAEVTGAIIVALAVGSWLDGRQATQTKPLVEPLAHVLAALGSYVLAGAISVVTPAAKESSQEGCDSWPVVNELAQRSVTREPLTGRPTGVLTQLDLGGIASSRSRGRCRRHGSPPECRGYSSRSLDLSIDRRRRATRIGSTRNSLHRRVRGLRRRVHDSHAREQFVHGPDLGPFTNLVDGDSHRRFGHTTLRSDNRMMPW